VSDKDFVSSVRATILRYNMLVPGHRLGLAVSGGRDSVALLEALAELGWASAVLHLNHGLRGAESDADEAFVRELAAARKLPFFCHRVQLQSHPGNLEDAARRARLAFFAAARQQLLLDRVATGHTRSDQAETVLFRLLRGAGGRGLAGILPVTREGIVRPLLDVTRRDTEHFLRSRGIPWREDSSNYDTRFARNRLRYQLIPQLEQHWNPALETVLSHTAVVALEDEQYWTAEINRLLPALILRRLPHAAVLDASALWLYPAAVRRRLLRALLQQSGLAGDFRQVERLLALLARRSGCVSLPGLEARLSFGQLRLGAACPAPPPPVEVTAPAQVRLGVHEVVLGREGYNGGELSGAALDWEKLSQPLYLRGWRPGDAYQPVGYRSVRKLHDLFQQARIPSWERATWPVMLSNNEIVWAHRFGPAAPVAPASGTRTVLIVRNVFPSE
jgi:tRNA(Ile)-lysidine synthase